MRLAACIEWLFEDEAETLPDRIRAAAAAGVHSVEFHLWRNKPLDDIKRALDETGIALTSFVVEPRRSLVDPKEHGEFLAALRDSLPIASQLGCPHLVIASGFTMKDTPLADQHAAIVHVLKDAAALAREAGITLLLEPLNSKIDHPGMYLVSVSEGLDIVEEVGSPALRLLFDAYHSAVMGDDAASVLRGRMNLVGHVQVADAPGRGPLGTGEIDWAGVVSALKHGGYAGPIGLEFKLNGISTREALASTRAALGG